MDPVILGLLVLIPLVQVPLVLWLGRYLAFEDDTATAPVAVDGSADPSTRTSPAPGGPGIERDPESPPLHAVDAVRCWQCGAVNDPAFRFCHNCVTALG